MVKWLVFLVRSQLILVFRCPTSLLSFLGFLPDKSNPSNSRTVTSLCLSQKKNCFAFGSSLVSLFHCILSILSLLGSLNRLLSSLFLFSLYPSGKCFSLPWTTQLFLIKLISLYPSRNYFSLDHSIVSCQTYSLYSSRNCFSLDHSIVSCQTYFTVLPKKLSLFGSLGIVYFEPTACK